MNQRTPRLVEALLEWRARDRKSQATAAALLTISRKTYILFEAGQWLPPDREKHFFAHTLAGLDPHLGETFARACGTTAVALGLAKPGAAPPPSPAQARAAYDAAVYSAAEEADLPPKPARTLVHARGERRGHRSDPSCA